MAGDLVVRIPRHKQDFGFFENAHSIEFRHELGTTDLPHDDIADNELDRQARVSQYLLRLTRVRGLEYRKPKVIQARDPSPGP